jgi:hypothetical protein
MMNTVNKIMPIKMSAAAKREVIGFINKPPHLRGLASETQLMMVRICSCI